MARILCIDDEDLLRSLIKAELECLGHEVFEARNGREGLDLLLEAAPDLVLCDVGMPIMDGYEVLSRLRSEHSASTDVPFLFLSGLSDRQDIIAGKRLGADDYLTKPIDMEILAATVEARLAQIARIEGHAAQRLRTDPETGLLNEMGLEDVLKSSPSSLAACEFDAVPSLSLVLGRQGAAELEAQAVSRLRRLAAGFPIARRSTLRFAVVFQDAAAALALADRLKSGLSASYSVGGKEIRPTVSVGLAVSESGSEILANADSALEWCRAEGGDGVQAYSADRAQVEIGRIALMNALRSALDSDELSLEFQPKARASDLSPVGAEALLRWDCAALGRRIASGLFVPIAEEIGLMPEIGAWVLRRACAAAARWRREGRFQDGRRIAVNVSPQQLRSKDWPASVSAALAETGLPASSLTLEITESGLIEDLDAIVARLESIRDLGVVVSIDDFGTGYSSFGHLHRLPVGEIKIDQSFVRGLQEDGENVLVSGVIGLARRLGLKVVAEGVETEVQMRVLADLGCDVLQGYLVARPLKEEALRSWLETGGVFGSAEAEHS